MSQEHIDRGGGALFRGEGQDGLLHRAFLRGEGFSAEDVRRSPVIGIATTASELNPCNAGLASLAQEVKAGVRAAGGLPLEFPTISLSEPFSRPSSMYLRNLMSMDVEEMVRASPIDGVVLLGGCDKTIPAQLMGALSAGLPAMVLAAGPRPVSCVGDNREFTVDDVWPLCEQRRVGALDDGAWAELEGGVNVGVGTCNVMGTATTMAAVAEVLGFALPGSTLPAAASRSRRAVARGTGEAIVAAVGRGEAPGTRVTLESLENAFRAITALGGSTNAVIHLEAIAGRAGLRIGRDRLDEWSRTTPVLADVRPGGRYLLEHLEAAGGVVEVLRRLGDRIHAGAPAADGRTWGEVLAATPPVLAGPDHPALRTEQDPVAPRGALRLMSGTLAPDGCVMKLAAGAPARHRARVVVFDGLEDLHARIDDPDLEVEADTVLVLRGLGMVGAPGMPEVGHLPIPARLHRQGVRDMVRISDARMSGTSTGSVVLHVSPESAVGGPLARLRTGDQVVIDAEAGTLDHCVPAAEFAAREPAPPPPLPARGFARLQARHALQPHEGCDLDFLVAVPEGTEQSAAEGDA
ncbi:dihydroxy-acid dehydratase [Citricoccus sp. SGAir0253]|uniref:dihydroxy-acid dehydratase n=1 Tax=Citricoccus sp. SGAir0253 TaxID=2567881 RepID=UPI0010CD4066|nr:dihydroxy-acid dehydratase [Citricoccus sp. SGAir0253]QCU77174.1 dihydroxy-acid dehydratase [Citricoccus sp. SGAir0253]